MMDKWFMLGKTSFALGLIFIGSVPLLLGGDSYFEPVWIAWPLLICGVALLVLMVWQLWLHWNDPAKPPHTEEEIKRAKEELDRMYFREHGTWPELSDDEEDR